MVRAQVALVEQLEKFLVVGSCFCIGQHECFEFSFAGEPIGGTMAEKLMKIVEIMVTDLIADFDCAGRMASFSEQRSESVLEELIVCGRWRRRR